MFGVEIRDHNVAAGCEVIYIGVGWVMKPRWWLRLREAGEAQAQVSRAFVIGALPASGRDLLSYSSSIAKLV